MNKTIFLLNFTMGLLMGLFIGRLIFRKDKRKLGRWFQHFWAKLWGYFWLPCPICGEYFGGHEWAGTWMKTAHSGVGVCANCKEEARRRSKKTNFISDSDYKTVGRA